MLWMIWINLWAEIMLPPPMLALRRTATVISLQAERDKRAARHAS